MKRLEKQERFQHRLLALRNYLIFFLILCFVITCCMMLFLHVFSGSTGLELQKEHIELAAKLTFVNIVVLSLICAFLDCLRRKIMIDRPVKHIVRAAEKVMEGDFSARIGKIRSIDPNDGFNTIIDYFNRMTEELSHTETLRTDFIANVSHEIKTPLAVMQNYGTMLQQPGLSEEKRMEYAKAFTDASRRLAEMVTNILKLNKLENQTLYPSARTYDLGEQLCACLLGFEDLWEDKNLDIQTEIQENVRVTADPELLSLVWNNLFSNAIKFTEPGGAVSLVLATEGDQAVVMVSDTGCGISQEVGKHIFEKFYQGDTSHAAKGNGLGLALVKRVIDITRGDIQVSSQVGKGSTFNVKLRRETDEKV